MSTLEVGSGEPSGAGGPSQPNGARARAGECIRGRYLLSQQLGRGGMAVAYRATDLGNGRDVALKQLLAADDGARSTNTASLFEREFRTLAQLSHPSIIEVYDFGVDDDGPFYTMELLEGGNLRDRTPLPWKEAVKVAYDICSSLALIHSRRLVHRDVTPRNVHFSRDGRAKLIDFGAIVPMGSSTNVVGTPQFMAPEVAHRSHLDARTDLFSLGATLYYALTRRSPYPARDVPQAVSAWKTKPLPPSIHVPDIPASLDALILSMVGVEPKVRPRTAFEVMHRLAAISGLEFAEPPNVSRSYLTTPELVGREKMMAPLRDAMERALSGHGQTVLVEGAAGLGRSRILDASALVAATLGLRVIRASGGTGRVGAFQTAQNIAEQLVEDSPDLAVRAAAGAGVSDILFEADVAAPGAKPNRPKVRDFRTSAIAPFDLQRALGRWIFRASEEEPLALSVDDVHAADSASLALVAALSAEAEGRPLLVVASAESGAEPTDAPAFTTLEKHSTKLQLSPLSRSDTEQLFESIFGDIPNVGVVSDGIYAIARGNPRASMDLAQHLVDRGVLLYESGTWTLPVRLEASDLPRDAEEAIRARLTALGPIARWLAEAQALATYQTFTRTDYAHLRADGDVDAAIAELVAQQVVTSDGRTYSITHRGYQAALLQSLSEEQRTERHRALIALYEGKLPLGVVRHALFAGLEQRALDELVPILPGVPEATNLYELTDLGALEVAATFERALAAAERIGRSPLETTHLRRWLASLAVVSDDRYYFIAAPGWLARLKYDSGYDIWEGLADVSDAAERLSRTMQGAFARHFSAPETERVHRPDEAVRGLVHFVGISLAIGSSRLDLSITESLPALLEPFAPLAPMVSIIRQNAMASLESSGRARWESARAKWKEVYGDLAQVDGVDPKHVGVFRRAVAHAIAVCEAAMGVATAAEWADRLEEDPALRVNGRLIKRIVSLEHGDTDRAEALRKEAEVLALQARSRQMFANLYPVELVVCWLTRDISGVKRCADSIDVLAARSPGWAPYVDLADAIFRLCCDDLEGALQAFTRTSAKTFVAGPSPLPAAWCYSVTGQVEALAGLGRIDEARRLAKEALDLAQRVGIGVTSSSIERALAVAEAKGGAVESAIQRLDAVILAQTAMGVGGVHLAALYEARARIAIAAKDSETFAKYVRLAEQQYGGGRSAPNASIERLNLEGIEITDLAASPSAADAEPMATRQTEALTQRIFEALGPMTELQNGAQRALDVICAAAETTSGHLYLLEPGGIRLAASLNGEPPELLREFMLRYVESSLDDETETQFFPDQSTIDETTTTRIFEDSSGSAYRPFLLTATVNEQVRCAGAVALAARAVMRVRSETIEAVSEWLLRGREMS